MSNESYIRHLMDEKRLSFYLYDEKIVARQIDALKSNLSQFDFLYSVKTNPFPAVVECVARHGIGADAASLREVEIAHKAGMKKDDIYYSCPGKSREDIEGAIGKAHLIADSLSELALINEIAGEKKQKQKVGLRINPDYAMGGGKGAPGKFGVDEEQLLENKDDFLGFANLEIVGIHVHVRSQVIDYETLYDYYKTIFALAIFCKERLSWNIEFINFGGGLGIAYAPRREQPLDVKKLAEKCDALVRDFKAMQQVRLILETGRYVICEAGTYVTRVNDVKTSRGKTFAILQNGLTGFMRPIIADLVGLYDKSGSPMANEPLFTSSDAFEISVLGKSGGEHPVELVGSLCTAADVFGRALLLPRIEIGDIVTVSNAGSYACTLSPNRFSSQPPVLEVFLKEDGSAVIV